MPGHHKLDFERLDYWTMTAGQWETLRWHVARRAERERRQAWRAMFRLLWSALRRVVLILRDGAAATAGWWRAHAERRQLRQAMAELHGFSDRELKDLGVRRSEIFWVVHHGRVDPPAHVISPPIAWSDPDSVTEAANDTTRATA